MLLFADKPTPIATIIATTLAAARLAKLNEGELARGKIDEKMIRGVMRDLLKPAAENDDGDAANPPPRKTMTASRPQSRSPTKTSRPTSSSPSSYAPKARTIRAAWSSSPMSRSPCISPTTPRRLLWRRSST